jgi:hypothetical protein
MYCPKKDIRNVREKIVEWTRNIHENLEEEQCKTVYDNICPYINSEHFPIIDVPFYEESLEGWKLIRLRNKLKNDYPRQYKEDLEEENRELIETDKMMNEDALYTSNKDLISFS